jgi:zinc transport system ATP-binding protein
LIQPCGGRFWTKENLIMGYVPQHTKFDRRFPINVFDVVLTGRLGDRVRLFKGYTAEDKRKVWEMLDQIGLKDLSKRQIGQLSGGQLQKVLIARALVAEPELLILDEPTANLDGDNKKDIYDLLHRYNEKHAVILVTHDLEYIEDNKRQVVLLNRTIRYRGDAQTRKRAFDHQHGGESHV